MYTEVVRGILNLIVSNFEVDLEIMIGKNHMYLRTDITFTYEGTVDIRIVEYIREAIKEFGVDIITSINTPRMMTLSEVKEDSKLMGAEKHDTYHNIVANFYMWLRYVD